MSISTDQQCRFLRELLYIRMVEESVAKEYAVQEMRCPVHLSIGQEAVAVGVCQALSKTDWTFSAHRSHANYLAKGGDVQAMIAELYGKQTGCAQGRAGSMHLADPSVHMMGTSPIVGGIIPVAVGAAFGHWQEHSSTMTAVFFGDGATEEGVFAESLNFAALKNLNILFVCENNRYSVYSPLSVRRPLDCSRVNIVSAHGIRTLCGDGNDVEEVYLLANQAIAHMQEGKGPVYLELETYRFREHCGHEFDDHLNYRPKEEVAYFNAHCPLTKYSEKLMAKQVVSKDELKEWRAYIAKQIDDCFAHAKHAPYPDVSTLELYTWAE